VDAWSVLSENRVPSCVREYSMARLPASTPNQMLSSPLTANQTSPFKA
jgi:hypothetical protein